jgi:hypothetical protein
MFIAVGMHPFSVVENNFGFQHLLKVLSKLCELRVLATISANG